eukprot:TRINITY_DN789_c0_g1_i1.p1 TRINITY_DN789_c0_g1~~TRINITY_DN789_c0_g1_i1.p1  ORF type:complete len:105 (+),score=23.77 TRINITY_DN789_c0_g1_i1:249-563(+)
MELGSIDEQRASTFVFNEEDHTLGNSLRYVLSRDPRVEFCGYSIPHPSENRVNVRVQTTGDPAKDVLKDSLQDLMAICQHVQQTFVKAVEAYKATHNVNKMESD